MNFSITPLVILVLFATVAFGCYEDEPIDPRADLSIFYLDEDGNELPYTAGIDVPFESIFIFRSGGIADNMVIWTGDRILNFEDAAFEFRPDSYDEMAVLGVDDDIIEALRELEGNTYSRELDLVRTIRRDTLFDINRYFALQNVIREAIFQPVTDASGMDSLRFTVNHVYQDFLEQETRGYYGVSGQIMKRLDDGSGFEFTKNGYHRRGTFNVTVVAVGVGGAGTETKTDIISQTIELSNQ